VYASADYGRPGSYVQLAAYTGSNPTWGRVQLDMGQFAGASTVRIMFVSDDNPESGGRPNDLADGWWLDDIRVEELPEPVTLDPISSSSMHHVDLHWSQNIDADFDRYEIRRATSTTVSRSSTLIASVTNQSVTSFTDSVAMIEPTIYSYRMYVIDVLGDVSLGSEIQTATYSVPETTFPFTDSMSDTTTNWAYGSPWGSTTTTYHSAPSSWTDSPGASYRANSNTSLATVVNLSTAIDPVLTFWHRYSFEESADYGHVEVSSDGGVTWSELLRVTGIDTTWTTERVDLGAYVGSTIGLRYRITSNADLHLDGWYIDDVEILNGSRAVLFPYTDDVESGVESWFADSPWGISDVNSYSGTYHWTDSPSGSYAPGENTSLAITVDLSETFAPALRYWQRYSLEPNADWGFVEISTNNGVSWGMVSAITGSSSDWRRDEIDLSPYRGDAQVMVRFRLQANSAQQSDGWHLDDIVFEEVDKEIAYPFFESFDDSSSASNWLTSSWEFVTNGRSSPSQLHDSPDGNYHTDIFSNLSLAGTLDLSGAVNPVMTFWMKTDLISQDVCCWTYEDDYARVYVSGDNGQIWTSMAAWTGSRPDWTKVTLDLSQFVGSSDVRVRFSLDDNTESGGRPNDVAGGWWIDDLRVEDLPQPVVISDITGSTQHHAALNWTLNGDFDFDRYEIRRATSTDVSRSSLLVANIDDRLTTAWTDTFAVVQPTHYSYRIYVIDTLNNVSPASNVVTADYSIPLMKSLVADSLVEYPALDSMMVDTPYWSWGAPWGPTTNSFHSAPTSWKSGPGRAYPPNANTALTTKISLAGSVSPVLTFWHRYAFQSGVDFGHVEVSKDDGATWAQVLKVTSIDTTWSTERIDLGAYLGETIGLRFRVTSNADTQLDGWYIDDVEINDGPRTASFPWTDDIESGVGSWFAQSPWGLSNVGSHSGQWHWADSPAGSYAPNESTALKVTIDLSGAASPVLKFWQRYSFQPNADWGYVEVSANSGVSWTQASFVTGSEASWRQEKIDLSPWLGNPLVMVRFRLSSNSSSESDGWHIDDVEIVDETKSISYPFIETFDDSTSLADWQTASWEFTTGGRSAPFLAHDSPLGNYPKETFSSLTMAGTIDLRGTVNPVLTFWHKRSLITQDVCCWTYEDDYARVYVSPDNGQVWYSMWAATGSATDWTKATISLSGSTGSTSFVGASSVRVRFVIDDNTESGGRPNDVANGWWIDDIRIGEDLAVASFADSARFEGPALIHATAGLATPRLTGRVYEPGLTPVAGQGSGVVGEFGFGPVGTIADDSTWTWFAGGYLDDRDGADRFFGGVRADSNGVYSTAFRASIDGGATWVYADLDGYNLAGGGVSEFEADHAGLLVVSDGGNVALSEWSLDRSIRVGSQQIWSITVGNDGPETLVWRLDEATAQGVVADVPWMVVQNPSGITPVGKGSNVDLAFDASGLAVDSTYTARLLITSNDLDEDSVWVPVAMTVLPEGTPGFTGWVAFQGGDRAPSGGITLMDELGNAVDTVQVSSNGWFAMYGVTPGQYDMKVQVPGAYPQKIARVDLPLEGYVIHVSRVHPFSVSPFSMATFSGASTLDGEPIPIGSVVTVRDEQGVVCGARVVSEEGSYGLLHIYSDDGSTVDVDEGASIGDVLSFFVNDVPTGAQTEYSNHNSVVRVDITAESVPLRHLDTGLHLISTNAAPYDTAITDILSTIAGKVSYVSGFDQNWGGARTWVDSLQAFSDLTSLDGRHAYWLRMDAPGDLSLSGVRVHDDTPLQLNAGWNLAPYLSAADREVEDALASIHEAIAVVGGFHGGAATYVPDSPFSDLTSLKYGDGYWMYLNSPATLNYRGESMDMPMARPVRETVSTDIPVPTREWMDIYGAITLNTESIPVGSIVTVYDETGALCGATTVRESGQYGFLHVYGDDPQTDFDEGASTGEQLSIRIDGDPVHLVSAPVWVSDNGVHRVDITASLTPTGQLTDRPLRFALHGAQPNPFNPTTTIRYEVAEPGVVKLHIYDQLGQRIRTLVDDVNAPGRYEVRWNARDDTGRNMASGTYIVRLVAPEGVRTTRITLLR
jgi:hypothetical protein